MRKVFRPGTIREGNRRVSIYFVLERRRDYWSFTGVIGPYRSGNAAGGCGQIVMEFAHRNPKDNDSRSGEYLIQPEDISFAKGWDGEKLFQFIDCWEKYHMKNNMPDSVFQFLNELPETDRQPAWC